MDRDSLKPEEPTVQPVAPAQAPREMDARGLLRLIHWMIGEVGHVEVPDKELRDRIRRRFQAEMGELTRLGFTWAFADGETASWLRFPLILPALTAFSLWREGIPAALYRGTRMLFAYPVLVSESEPAFANPSEDGVKFYTAFEDGTLLVSKNYDFPFTAAPGIVRQARKATIADAWKAHQERLRAMEAIGKAVDRRMGHRDYARLSKQETAAW
jgi:hypothetical protein